MEEYFFQQEVDFSDRPLRDFLSQSRPAYSMMQKKFWKHARSKSMFPGSGLLSQKEFAKTNVIFKNAYLIAWKCFSRLTVSLDALGQFKAAVQVRFPLTLVRMTPDLSCLCKSILVCDEFTIAPKDSQSFDLVFVVRIF